jgi:putative OPT family oligopeptide transporter
MVRILGGLAGKLQGRGPGRGAVRTERDLSFKWIMAVLAAAFVVLGFAPFSPVGPLGAVAIICVCFLSTTVTARIVGVVGSTNAPVSGLTMMALAGFAFIFKLTGDDGPAAMAACLLVSAIICSSTTIAGDTSQDLKTGFLLGATPSRQQLGELIGVAASSLVVGGFVVLLHKAWGLGSAQLPAPQAMLMKTVVESIMGGDFPRPLLAFGVALGILCSVLRIPALAIAVGLYLPAQITAPLFAGGMARLLVDRLAARKGETDAMRARRTERGVLFSSGLIAGEALVGLLLAVFTVTDMDFSLSDEPVLGPAWSCLGFLLLMSVLAKVTWLRKDARGPAAGTEAGAEAGAEGKAG